MSWLSACCIRIEVALSFVWVFLRSVNSKYIAWLELIAMSSTHTLSLRAHAYLFNWGWPWWTPRFSLALSSRGLRFSRYLVRVLIQGLIRTNLAESVGGLSCFAVGSLIWGLLPLILWSHIPICSILDTSLFFVYYFENRRHEPLQNRILLLVPLVELFIDAFDTLGHHGVELLILIIQRAVLFVNPIYKALIYLVVALGIDEMTKLLRISLQIRELAIDNHIY